VDNFFELIAEILEVDIDDISLETDFRKDIEDWDSMKGFAIICLIEDEYDRYIDVPTFLNCITLGDLYKKATNAD